MSSSLITPTAAQEDELIQQLKDLVQETGDEFYQEDIKHMDHSFILMYIRYANYNLKRAFDCGRRFALARRVKYIEVFNKLHPGNYKSVYEKYGTDLALKNRDEKGRHIIIFRFCYWKVEEMTFDDVMGTILLMGMEMLHEVESQLNGFIVIVDAGGFSLKQAKYLGPSIVQKYVDIITKLSPIKFKEFHVINAPWIFNTTLSLIKMFLSQRFRKLIYAHGSSMESMHKWVSPKILPVWLGGSLSDEVAFDHNITQNLCSQERENYYRKLIDPNY